MLLASCLPVRFTDDLAIEVDSDAAGRVLTPVQAQALARRLVEQACHKQARLRASKRAEQSVLVAGLGKPLA